MNELRRALAERLYAEGRAADAGEPDRLRRRRNLEPESAAFLRLQVLLLRPPAVLELGTSNGYSTLWLADACESTRSRCVTVDNDPDRAAEAGANLAAAGLSGAVEQRVADAAEVLADSATAQWGLVFLDAERPAYVGYWPDLRRVVAPGGLLVVDNCLSHADQVADFRALVDADRAWDSVLLPVGAGLLLAHRPGAADGS